MTDRPALSAEDIVAFARMRDGLLGEARQVEAESAADMEVARRYLAAAQEKVAAAGELYDRAALYDRAIAGAGPPGSFWAGPGPLSDADRVLAAMQQAAGADGICEEPINLIACRLRLGRDAVRRLQQTLRERRLITEIRPGRAGRPTRWRVEAQLPVSGGPT